MCDNINEANDELPSSDLGTKDYWDEAYLKELANFDDHGEFGDIWFGKKIMKEMVYWICSKFSYKRDVSPILDIGCGNGMSLVMLYREGFRNLTGIDYSQSAVELARKVSDANACTDIKYKVTDILDQEVNLGLFDAIMDKGTFDAICLNPSMTNQDSIRRYKNFVRRHLVVDGLFIICSCNWTKDELLKHFSDLELDFVHDIDTPQMIFGGKTGRQVTGLVFQRK